METKQRRIIILILGILSAIGPFSIDMYLPAFTAIATSFNTTINLVSYSLSSFFIGICVGQILCGPILDRFGRKKPLLIGLVIYVFATIGCAYSYSIHMFIFMRFLQAIGCCVTMVAPRAVIRDLFPVEENAKIFSLLILILGVSPLLAPTTGSLIVASFNWSYVFIVLTVISIFTLIGTYYLLPESYQPDPSVSLRPKPIITAFVTVAKNPQFYTYCLMASVSFAGLFAYLSGSPFVFMKLYGVSQRGYGLIFATIAAGFIGCSQLNNFVLRKYSSAQIVNVMLPVQVAIGIFLLAGTVFDFLGLYGTIVTTFFYLSTQGFIFPNSSALSMAPFTKEAGSASALLGSIQMMIGSFTSALVGLLANGTAIPMTGIIAGCSSLALLILILGRKNINTCAISDISDEAIEMIEKF